MESVFSGTLIQKMTKFPHGDNFYEDPDITSFLTNFSIRQFAGNIDKSE